MQNLTHVTQRPRAAILTSMLCASMFWTVCSYQLLAQVSSRSPEDLYAKYPVKTQFKGRPALPVLSGDARTYRTRIREGVAEGVVFAGHYEVAVWGCGTRCISFAIINAVTGKVDFFPASISQGGLDGGLLTYKRDSKAIHVIGGLNETDPADRWYVWDDRKFSLISKRPIVPKHDNDSESEP